MPKLDFSSNVLLTKFELLLATLMCVGVSLRSRYALTGENRFLRKQLALSHERRVKAPLGEDC